MREVDEIVVSRWAQRGTEQGQVSSRSWRALMEFKEKVWHLFHLLYIIYTGYLTILYRYFYKIDLYKLIYYSFLILFPIQPCSLIYFKSCEYKLQKIRRANFLVIQNQEIDEYLTRKVNNIM